MLLIKDRNESFNIPDKVYSDSGEVYELHEVIGKGGNAVVVECIDCEGEMLAIKFLLNLYAENLERFKQEIRVLRSLKHPHLLWCVDEGEVTGKDSRERDCAIPFMVMERADMDLKTLLKRKGALDYSEYFPQFIGLSQALALLNEVCVHRDIKLENILIVGDRWVLSDLGLCTYINEDHVDLTRANEKIGPKYWMSPEAINRIYSADIEIVPASDVFQLSAVFWYAVNRRYPLGIMSKDDWINNDYATCEVLLKGLTYNLNVRPKDGHDFLKCLENVKEQYEMA